MLTHQEIIQAWANSNFIKAAAAESLGISRSTFRDRLRAALSWSKNTKEGKEYLKRNPIVPSKDISIQSTALINRIKQLENEIDSLREKELSHDEVRKGILGLKDMSPKAPEWLNNSGSKDYHHGIPGLFLSDLHVGEVVNPKEVFGVNEYNSNIAMERIRRVADSTINLTHNIMKDPKYNGIVLKLGGDNVNGIIHEELQIGSDSMMMEQIMHVVDILHSVILKFIKIYGRVYVVGVPGNHGRTTRRPYAKFYAATNCDWIIYQILERTLIAHIAQGNVQFNCPPARDVTYKVAGRRFRLTHGDQFRGGDGMIGFLGPVTRGTKKKQSMALSLPTNDEHFETLEMGHFHSLHMTQNLIVNGSIKGYDEYAMANNFAYEPPQQALTFTHHKYGINHFMPVLADEPKAPVNSKWVEWQEGGSHLNRFIETLGWVQK